MAWGWHCLLYLVVPLATGFIFPYPGRENVDTSNTPVPNTDICAGETFTPQCPSDHVILMETALYGQMRMGRCIRQDTGNVGCQTDVLRYLDRQCSGRRDCSLEWPGNDVLELNVGCPYYAPGYLEAGYSCVPVLSTRDYHQQCQTEGRFVISGLSDGVIASSTIVDDQLSPSLCPWVIQGQPGQRINLTLLDFGLSGQQTGGPVVATCHVYARLHEESVSRATTVCSGSQRETDVYTSESHELEIEFLDNGGSEVQDNFLFRFTVAGCPDPPLRGNVLLERTADKVVVHCNNTVKESTLYCHGNQWNAQVEDCSSANVIKRTDFADCATPAVERFDCGYYGISLDECVARDCCWAESTIPGVPWCYHTISHAVDTCLIDVTEKDDCGYYGINSEQCTERGCCWMPASVPGTPWCYHPIAPTFGGDCGRPVIPPAVRTRIVGGLKAVAHSWPWQASLHAGGSHFCGASLISPRWLVSAAHCAPAFEYHSSRSVILGLHNQEAMTSSLEVGIENVIIHEDYDEYIYNNDIMLIRLDRDVDYVDEISPACLPNHVKEVAEGTDCYTTGWGTTQSGGSLATSLQQVMVPIIDHTTCNQEGWYGGQITENMVCAGYAVGGKDSCQGDSGGPLVCMQNGRWVLSGVVSWGEGCARKHRPGVYTNVANYIQWIEDTMAKYS